MSKQKVAIVVDSTAYIPKDLVEKYDLHVIPLILNWEGKSFHDDVDITSDEFFIRLQTAKEMPTTSQPSAGEFKEFFEKVAETADSILAILISEPLSGTQASARLASDMMDSVQIEIVDSRSTSMGLGYMALAAARALEGGASMEEAAAVARNLVAKMRVILVVDTLEFLHRGGRIGGANRLIGSMLSIKPILHLENGKIEPLAKIRTKKKAVKRMIELATEEMKGKSDVRIAVIDALADKEAQQIYNEINSRLNPVEIVRTGLSPVIGAHVGPGTVGLAFFSEAD